ncbi:hypothetical protein SLE2022_251850 [Rubroshorea leprosula]
MAAQPCPCSGAALIFPQRQNSYHHVLRLGCLSFSRLHRRLRPQAARQSRRSRRNWDSNAETVRTESFSFNPQSDDEEEEDEDGSSGSLEEVIDSLWSFKVFKSYGLLFPAIFISALLATGPKALLMALAFPVGQSIFSLAFEKLSGGTKKKQKRRARKRRKTSSNTVKNNQMEREVQVDDQDSRDGKGYQSRMATDNGSVNKGDQYAPNFGGWDDLTGTESVKRPYQVKSGKRKATKSKGKGKLSMEGRRSDAPLLLRLLIAVFPFLGSWTKLFW